MINTLSFTERLLTDLLMSCSSPATFRVLNRLRNMKQDTIALAVDCNHRQYPTIAREVRQMRKRRRKHSGSHVADGGNARQRSYSLGCDDDLGPRVPFFGISDGGGAFCKRIRSVDHRG